MSGAYYNENDPFCVEWLRRLIVAGMIAPGDVDDRSILDVRPSDLRGYDQHHFFAGIGVWSYALREAGWSDDRPVWTGSCPCQPFSAAGKRGGFADERHLWPVWFELIKECKPDVILGEQVASAAILGHSRSGSTLSAKISTPKSSENVDSSRQVSREKETLTFRSGRLRESNSATDRLRGLLSDGSAVQSGRRSDLGQSVVGSEGSEVRVCFFERKSDSPCFEQCYRRLGRETTFRYSESNCRATPRKIERFIDSLSESSEDKAKGAWFDAVSSDLERAHYTVAASDMAAAGVGAPHIRQRLWWLAHHHHEGQRQRQECDGGEVRGPDRQTSCRCDACRRSRMGDTSSSRGGWDARAVSRTKEAGWSDGRQSDESIASSLLVEPESQQAGVSGRARQSGEPLAHHHHPRLEIVGQQPSRGQCATAERSGETGALQHAESDGRIERRAESERRSASGFWRETDWIPCRDGKWRPVEPGTFPLVDRAPSRVGRLRGYGNAIVAPLATAFVETVIDILDEHRLTS